MPYSKCVVCGAKANGKKRCKKHADHNWAMCGVEGCERRARSMSGALCDKHYVRLRETGSVYLRPRDLAPPSISDTGYVKVSVPGHPMARGNKRSDRGHRAYEHRVVLYDKIGPGVHLCTWCKSEIEWGAPFERSLIADHLDGVKTNNLPDNLVPSCSACNRARGGFMWWVMEHLDDPFLWMLYERARASV